MSGLKLVHNVLVRASCNWSGRIGTISARSLHTTVLRPRSFAEKYRLFWKDHERQPPWNHCSQIGDPVLRETTCDIPLENIKDSLIEKVLEHMKKTLRSYKLVGIAANQIGISFSIIMIEFRKEYAENVATGVFKAKDMEIVPLMVVDRNWYQNMRSTIWTHHFSFPQIVINPKLKVLNYNQRVFHEGCASVCGYTAEVPRYEEVLLSGYNEKAEPVEYKLKGWTARIAQHEYDHLNGKLFTDIMDKSTLTCSVWPAVNFYGGKLSIPFHPKTRRWWHWQPKWKQTNLFELHLERNDVLTTECMSNLGCLSALLTEEVAENRINVWLNLI